MRSASSSSMGLDFGVRLPESAQKAIQLELEQQQQQEAEGRGRIEGEREGEDLPGTPGGILRDPWVQRGLALIVGAFVGGGIAYVVFGRKE